AGEIALATRLWSAEEQRRQKALIAAAGLPQAWPSLDPAAVLRCLQADKKVKDGRVRFVLPTRIGAVEIRDDVDSERILGVLANLAAERGSAP
ncbi:MAG: 3-dehydroquinate synthase, partial [Synechococcaceae cyanobacterium]